MPLPLPVPVTREARAIADPNGQPRAENILGAPVVDSMWALVVEITPDTARELLRLMPPQRDILPSNVAAFEKHLREGTFLLTHQGLAFDEHGRVGDGQHRLLACVNTGIGFMTLVVFNVPRRSIVAMDRGLRRTAGQDLTILGYVDRQRSGEGIAAAARWVAAVDAGATRPAKLSRHGTDTFDLVAVIDRHPLLVETGKWCAIRSHKRHKRVPAAPFAGLVTLTREADEARAMRFAEQIITRANIEEGDPAYALLRAQETDTGSNTLAGQSRFVVRFIFAWNAFFAGRKTSKLYSETKSDGLPRIAGSR